MSILRVMWDKALEQGVGEGGFTLEKVAALAGSPPPGWNRMEVRAALQEAMTGPWIKAQIDDDYITWEHLLSLATARPDWEDSATILAAQRLREAHRTRQGTEIVTALEEAGLPPHGCWHYGAMFTWLNHNPAPELPTGPWKPLDFTLARGVGVPDMWWLHIEMEGRLTLELPSENDDDVDYINMAAIGSESKETIQKKLEQLEDEYERSRATYQPIDPDTARRLQQEAEEAGRQAMLAFLARKR